MLHMLPQRLGVFITIQDGLANLSQGMLVIPTGVNRHAYPAGGYVDMEGYSWA